MLENSSKLTTEQRKPLIKRLSAHTHAHIRNLFFVVVTKIMSIVCVSQGQLNTMIESLAFLKVLRTRCQQIGARTVDIQLINFFFGSNTDATSRRIVCSHSSTRWSTVYQVLFNSLFSSPLVKEQRSCFFSIFSWMGVG